MPPKYTAICPHCHEPFSPRRKEQRCCSRSCAYEARKAESAARFWARVVDNPETGCRIFTGHLAHEGHGVVWWFGRNEQAHRVAWILAHGSIPDGHCVLHNCPGGDNPACVNIQHLWLGDRTANNADRDAKGRTGRGPREHPERCARGEQIARAKLCAEDIRAIRRAVADGTSQATLARRYGVNKTGISKIVRRETWKHVA